jgi:hypothetical protein
MTTMSNEDFAMRVMLMSQSAEQFAPRADYDPDGDCIEFLVKPDPFYAKRVDDLVTVYYSQITDEVIGSLIKGVSEFCKTIQKTFPGFVIAIQDRRVRLEHLFLARMWTQTLGTQGIPALTYKKLAEIAERSDLDAEVCTA